MRLRGELISSISTKTSPLRGSGATLYLKAIFGGVALISL